MFRQSLPLWGGAGLHASGAACETLDLGGRPTGETETRVRVQARQLYCFSLAHELGWDTGGAAAIAGSLHEVLTSACRRSDGLYGRRVDLTTQTLVDDTPDLYDNAFSLLALATARRALGAERVDADIDALLAALDRHMARQGGGYAEFLPAPPYRLQNPHMHLFESTLALFAATGDPDAARRAAHLYDFIQRRFFDPDAGCVNEFDDPVDASQRGWFEPGHSMEWTWLLGWRTRLFGEPYPAFGYRLYDTALATLDDAGRAVMSVNADGTKRDASRRLWSQTETLKAHLCMMELGVGEHARLASARAARCARGILDEWLQPAVPGGWLDRFDADGQLIATSMPASSGYHVYCAIGELLRLA